MKRERPLSAYNKLLAIKETFLRWVIHCVASCQLDGCEATDGYLESVDDALSRAEDSARNGVGGRF